MGIWPRWECDGAFVHRRRLSSILETGPWYSLISKLSKITFFEAKQIIFRFLDFVSKLPRLLLTVIRVTTVHKIFLKRTKNSIPSLGQSPLQELEAGSCSGPYLLVLTTTTTTSTV